MTLRQALIRVRLKSAQRLLETGHILVKEAAHNTGWKNQFYFSNSFKKRFGYSPTQIPISKTERPRASQLR